MIVWRQAMRGMLAAASALPAALLATVLLAMPFAAPAHADALDDAVAALVQDAPYAEAREKLLAAGWQPMAFDMTTLAGRCSFREEICTTYPEAEDCSGTGMGFCLFRFEADGRKLSVTTAGEEITDLVVYGWETE